MHPDHEPENIFDLGLQKDLDMWLRSPLDRRRALRSGLLGLGALLGSGQMIAQAAATCVGTIPSETAGPFPGDGSNGRNVLNQSGIVRSDIRTSLGTKNTAPGVPLEIELTLVNSAKSCAPLAGYALYAWHCTRDGNYSMYSPAVTKEDFLRGVQATDKNGKVSFKSIFPGCYAGRWPHVHFEVYPSLVKATNASSVLHTSQLALPEATCKAIYNTADGYAASVRNLARLSLATDMVFRDGVELQMATVTGDAKAGYKAALTVGIAV